MTEKNDLKGKRTGFVERWARAEEISAYLGITLYAVIALCIVLLFVVFRLATKPKDIYYIPGAAQAGISYPNRIDKSQASAFASNWLLDRNNFTPLTAKDTYERAMRYMAPELLSKTKASLESEVTRVKQDNISSLFSLSKDPEVLGQGADYKVTLTGQKALYMGKERLDERILRYTITLKRIPPIEDNPYGLAIEGVKQEEVESK